MTEDRKVVSGEQSRSDLGEAKELEHAHPALGKILDGLAGVTLLCTPEGRVDRCYGDPGVLERSTLADLVGRKVADLLPSLSADTLEESRDEPRTARVQIDGGRSELEVRIIPVSDDGRLALVVREPSDEQEQLSRLRRQNLMYAADLARAFVRWKDGQRRIRTTAKQAAQAERLSVLGQMAAGLAHEAKNLLMPVTLYAQLLSERRDELEQKDMELVDSIHEAAQRVSSLLHRILDAGRPGDTHTEPVVVGELFENVEAIIGSTLKRSSTELEVAVDSDLPRIQANPQELEQVLVNLIANALDAMTEPSRTSTNLDGAGGPGADRRIRIEARVESLPPQGTDRSPQGEQTHTSNGDDDPVVVLRVTDSGPGIPDDVLPRIFDPFFTTKAPEHGTGLGLFVSHETIRALGGTLEARNETGGGACFEIRLPGLASEGAKAVNVIKQ
jgi:signal transduction histidine kinase